MRIWHRFLSVVGSWVPVVLISIVVVVVALDVAGRTIASKPLYAAAEIAIVAFVWLVWLGFVGAAERGELIGVAYFVDKLPKRPRAWVIFFVDSLTVLVACGTMYAAYNQIMRARVTSYELIGVPKWTSALGLFIGMGFVALIYAARAFEKLREGLKP